VNEREWVAFPQEQLVCQTYVLIFAGWDTIRMNGAEIYPAPQYPR